VGGSLGLSLLVTVFGAASAAAATHPLAAATPVLQARLDFAAGADRVFLVSAAFVIATLVLALVGIRERRSSSRIRPVEDAAA